MNLPRTVEGRAVWSLAQRLGGQLRVVAGPGGAAVLGWDMTAALALARALGVPEAAVAELLPEIEAAMSAAMNAQAAAAAEGQGVAGSEEVHG